MYKYPSELKRYKYIINYLHEYKWLYKKKYRKWYIRIPYLFLYLLKKLCPHFFKNVERHFCKFKVNGVRLQLLDSTFKRIDLIVRGEKLDDFELLGVKEYMGSIVFETSSCKDTRLKRLLEKAQKKSSSRCVFCGSKGEFRKYVLDTMCDDCFAKYVKKDNEVL